MVRPMMRGYASIIPLSPERQRRVPSHAPFIPKSEEQPARTMPQITETLVPSKPLFFTPQSEPTTQNESLVPSQNQYAQETRAVPDKPITTDNYGYVTLHNSQMYQTRLREWLLNFYRNGSMPIQESRFPAEARQPLVPTNQWERR